MKQNYIKPEAIVEELAVETMLATSDRIPLDKEPSTPAANEHRGSWGDLWADGIDE